VGGGSVTPILSLRFEPQGKFNQEMDRKSVGFGVSPKRSRRNKS